MARGKKGEKFKKFTERKHEDTCTQDMGQNMVSTEADNWIKYQRGYTVARKEKKRISRARKKKHKATRKETHNTENTKTEKCKDKGNDGGSRHTMVEQGNRKILIKSEEAEVNIKKERSNTPRTPRIQDLTGSDMRYREEDIARHIADKK